MQAGRKRSMSGRVLQYAQQCRIVEVVADTIPLRRYGECVLHMG